MKIVDAGDSQLGGSVVIVFGLQIHTVAIESRYDGLSSDGDFVWDNPFGNLAMRFSYRTDWKKIVETAGFEAVFERLCQRPTAESAAILLQLVLAALPLAKPDVDALISSHPLAK